MGVILLVVLVGGCERSRIDEAKRAAAAGRFPEAIGDLQNEVAEHPDNADAWMMLGRLRLLDARDEEGREALEMAMRLDPDDAGEVAGVYFDAAKSPVSPNVDERMQRAWMDEAARVDGSRRGDVGTWYFTLASAKLDEKKERESAELFERAIELDPKLAVRAADRCERGAREALAAGRPEGAVPLALAAEQFDPALADPVVKILEKAKAGLDPSFDRALLDEINARLMAGASGAANP